MESAHVAMKNRATRLKSIAVQVENSELTTSTGQLTFEDVN